MPLSDDIVATGSSDGMVRIVSILPNKLSQSPTLPQVHRPLLFHPAEHLSLLLFLLAFSSVGVITHHNDFPIERLALSHDSAILGSASHDECVKLTDVRDIFDESDDNDEDGDSDDDSDVEMGGAGAGADGDAEMDDEDEESEEEPAPEPEPEPVVRKGREKRKEKPANREEEERNERGRFFDDM